MRRSCKFVSYFLSVTLCISLLTVVPVFAQNKELDCTEIILAEVAPDEFLSRLISSDSFSLEDYFSEKNQVAEVDNYTDFSTMSRFEIADWAYQNNLISEAQKIESYCDLIENRTFEYVVCLDSIYSEIENYANTNLMSASLNGKISSVLEPSALQYQNTRTTEHFIEIDDIIIHDVDNVLSDSVLNVIGEYASSLKTMFGNMGFNFPNVPGTDYIIALSTSTTGETCSTQFFSALSSTTCLVSTHIYGVNNSTNLSDSLRQRIAHGMFHAIQSNYYCAHIDHSDHNLNNYIEGAEWFREACADWGAWATTGLTTGVNFNAFINSGECMTQNIGNGAMLFPATIARYYGGAATIEEIYYQLYVNVRGIGESDFDFLETAVNGALVERGYTYVDFADIVSQMSVYLATPAIYSFVATGLQNTVAADIIYSDGYDFQEDNIDGLDRVYFTFTPDVDPVDYELDFRIVMYGGTGDFGTVQQYWYNDSGDLITEYLVPNANGIVSFTHPHYEEGNPSGFVGIVITGVDADAAFDFFIEYEVTQY